MDVLTHLFLPLVVAYALRRELFDPPWHLGLAGFALLPDFDKFLGYPGLLHSLVTVVPISIALVCIGLGVERAEYGAIAVTFLWSHLLLDVLDGGPVPLLSPFLEAGVGLTYPLRTTFGEGLLGIVFHGPPVALRITAPRPGFNTYGFVNGFGVASMLVFVTLYVGCRLNSTEDSQ